MLTHKRMSQETILLAIIAIVAPAIAAATGLYQAKLSRQNKQAEAAKTQAEADTLAAQVKVLYLENEKHLLERVSVLERDKYTCAARLDALEQERRQDKQLLEEAKRARQAAEAELAETKERYEGQMMALQAEILKLKKQIEQLANKVGTGELSNGKQRRAEA